VRQSFEMLWLILTLAMIAVCAWACYVHRLRKRRFELLQSICAQAIAEPDGDRKVSLIWFANFLITNLEFCFEVKVAMPSRGLLTT
jgi:hypothetical protein